MIFLRELAAKAVIAIVAARKAAAVDYTFAGQAGIALVLQVGNILIGKWILQRHVYQPAFAIGEQNSTNISIPAIIMALNGQF
jgi:hypothetical protein